MVFREFVKNRREALTHRGVIAIFMVWFRNRFNFYYSNQGAECNLTGVVRLVVRLRAVMESGKRSLVT